MMRSASAAIVDGLAAIIWTYKVAALGAANGVAGERQERFLKVAESKI
jgi:TPP-dependent 2-oxoacid decarboxylase